MKEREARKRPRLTKGQDNESHWVNTIFEEMSVWDIGTVG